MWAERALKNNRFGHATYATTKARRREALWRPQRRRRRRRRGTLKSVRRRTPVTIFFFDWCRRRSWGYTFGSDENCVASGLLPSFVTAVVETVVARVWRIINHGCTPATARPRKKPISAQANPTATLEISSSRSGSGSGGLIHLMRTVGSSWRLTGHYFLRTW